MKSQAQFIWWKFQWKAYERDLMSEGIDSTRKCLSPLGHWFKCGPSQLWPKAVTIWQLFDDLREMSRFRLVPIKEMSTPRGTYSCSRHQSSSLLETSEELPAALETVWAVWTWFTEAPAPHRGCYTQPALGKTTHTNIICFISLEEF